VSFTEDSVGSGCGAGAWRETNVSGFLTLFVGIDAVDELVDVAVLVEAGALGLGVVAGTAGDVLAGALVVGGALLVTGAADEVAVTVGCDVLAWASVVDVTVVGCDESVVVPVVTVVVCGESVVVLLAVAPALDSPVPAPFPSSVESH
jgi:hypothetical protein